MRSLRGGGGRQPCRFASDCGNYLEEDEEEGLFKAKQLTRWTLRTSRTSGTLLLSTNPVKKGRGGGGRGGQAGGRAERESERELRVKVLPAFQCGNDAAMQQLQPTAGSVARLAKPPALIHTSVQHINTRRASASSPPA